MPGWLRRRKSRIGAAPDNQSICTDAKGRLRLCDSGVDLRNLSDSVRRSVIGGMAWYDYVSGKAILGHEPTLALGDYANYMPTNMEPPPLKFISTWIYQYAHALTRIQTTIEYRNSGQEEADIVDAKGWGPGIARQAWPIRAYLGDSLEPLPSYESQRNIAGGGLVVYRLRIPPGETARVYLTDDPMIGGEPQGRLFDDFIDFSTVPRYSIVYGSGYLYYMYGAMASPCNDRVGTLRRYTQGLAVTIPLSRRYQGEVTLMYYTRYNGNARWGVTLWDSGGSRGAGVAYDAGYSTGSRYLAVEERSGTDATQYTEARTYSTPYRTDMFIGLRLYGDRAQPMFTSYNGSVWYGTARLSGSYTGIDSLYLYTINGSIYTFFNCIGVAETSSENVQLVRWIHEMAVDIELGAPIERVLLSSSDPNFQGTVLVWDNGAWRPGQVGRPVALQNAPTRLFLRAPVFHAPLHYAVLVDLAGG